jgi:hypothetical protein
MHFAAMHESAFGTKQTSLSRPAAFEGEADMLNAAEVAAGHLLRKSSYLG